MDEQDLPQTTPPTAELPARKRLRTSHACDICRARKIRCDGNNPCASCAAAEQDCTYGSEANSRGKSDLILEGVLRVERFLQEISASIATSPLLDRRPSFFSQAAGSSQYGESPTNNTNEAHTQPAAPFLPPRTPASEANPHTADYARNGHQNSLENAVLDSMHTSTTESVLQWPHFDVFPSLRRDYVSIFELEQSRPPVQMKPTSIMYPFVSDEETEAILGAFQNNVNFWYPTLTRQQLDSVRLMAKCFHAGVAEEYTVQSCLALMIMALGCASQAIAGLVSSQGLSGEELQRRSKHRNMGDVYFEHALRRLHVVHMDLGSTSTQCLFFAGIYSAFLRRPIQAWEFINAASAKCLLLLSYTPTSQTAEDRERVRRIFWSCYILESDYLAELSALPPSGISRIESSVPLPASYPTHSSPQQEEQSSLYLLACISMRRLLNRVHQLLYARGTGASLDAAKFPYVVAELNHQLDEWRDVLPSAFSFTIDTQPCKTEAGSFLRQRYLTCRSVIYRPYLMWQLSGVSGGSEGLNVNNKPSRDALMGCRACLEACLLHILNLRGFAQTVLVDTWICSLSMAAAMLVLLAASRVPALRGVIGTELLTAGDHLRKLLTSWQEVSGEPRSPSVDQSVQIICKADEFIKQVYAAGDMLALYEQGA